MARQPDGNSRPLGSAEVIRGRVLEAAGLAAVVGMAVVLRAWGIHWGLPNADQMCTYHPDEGVNLFNGVLDRGVARPHLDIGFYNYGSFYFLLWQVAVAVNSAYGFVAVPSINETKVPPYETLGAMILVGRLLSVLMAVLTCMMLWWYGRVVGRRGVGLVAGTTYAVIPLAVVHAHFATVDVTATCLATASMLLGAWYLQKGRLGAALASGLLAGLAAATRYNVVLVTAVPLTAVALRWWQQRRDGEGPASCMTVLGVVAVGVLAGFLFGCPGALLNWPKFSSDIVFEARKSAQGMGLLFQDTGNGWVYHYASSLRHGLGLPLLAVVTAAVLLADWRRCRELQLILPFVLVYYLFMGAAQVRFARYMIPLLPPLCLIVGFFGSGMTRFALIRRIGAAVVVLGVLPALHASVAYAHRMASTDPRDEAAEFIQQALPRGATIAFATTPWYWSPPLLPVFTAPVPGAARRRLILAAPSEYRLLLPRQDTEWDTRVLTESAPDCVVISDLESQDALRLHLPQALEFHRLARIGRRTVRFGGRPRLWGIVAASETYLPNDMLYVCPRITVYVRAGMHR